MQRRDILQFFPQNLYIFCAVVQVVGDIPELPENASDDTIDDAISRISNAIDILKRAKDALSRDISEIAQLKKYVNQQDDIPEFAAEAKSIEIKHTLASESGMRLTETSLELIDFLSI